jgi:hypothetical protein
MPLRLVVQYLCSLALLCCALPVQANLIFNGDFEAGDFSGWTATGNVQNFENAAVFNGGDTSPTGVLSQTIATTVGVRYVVLLSHGVLSFTGSSQTIRIDVIGAYGTIATSTKTTSGSVPPLLSRTSFILLRTVLPSSCASAT